MENPKFQIFRGANSQYYFRLRARNGESILYGEGYTTKQACQAGIAAVKANAPYDNRYTRHNNSVSNYTFNLHAANHEIIGRSENGCSQRTDRRFILRSETELT